MSYFLICFLPRHNVWAVMSHPEMKLLVLEEDGYVREMTKDEMVEYQNVKKATDN